MAQTRNAVTCRFLASFRCMSFLILQCLLAFAPPIASSFRVTEILCACIVSLANLGTVSMPFPQIIKPSAPSYFAFVRGTLNGPLFPWGADGGSQDVSMQATERPMRVHDGNRCHQPYRVRSKSAVTRPQDLLPLAHTDTARWMRLYPGTLAQRSPSWQPTQKTVIAIPPRTWLGGDLGLKNASRADRATTPPSRLPGLPV